MQGKTVRSLKHSDLAGAGSEETQRRVPRCTFEDQAQSVQCDLVAGITPAIERMLQVCPPARLAPACLLACMHVLGCSASAC